MDQSTLLGDDGSSYDFLTLLDKLGDERACYEKILLLKNIESFGCNNGCGSLLNLRKRSQFSGGCSLYCKTCKKDFNVAKTINNNFPKIELRRILIHAFLFCLKTRSWQNKVISGLSKTTQVKLKKTFIRIIEEKATITKIGGPGCVVQIDETACNRRRIISSPTSEEPYVRGTKWIIGAYCEVTKRKKIALLPDRTVNSFKNFIQNNIQEGTTIKTDGYPSYVRSVPESGCNHLVVNHNHGFVNEDGVHTNSIESLWSMLKLEIRSRRGVVFSEMEEFIREYQIKLDNIMENSQTDICLFFELLVKLF